METHLELSTKTTLSSIYYLNCRILFSIYIKSHVDFPLLVHQDRSHFCGLEYSVPCS